MKKFVSTLAALLLALSVAPLGAQEHEGGEENHADGRVFELRTYTTPEGKLPNLLARFRNHTNYIFVKHGMKLVGYWTPTDEGKDNTLIYILAHDSREAAKKSWAAFAADPDWKAAAAESRKNGRLVSKVVSQFLAPTDFSPIH